MYKIKRLFFIVMMCLVPFVLSSCLFPEEFDSVIEVKKDGTFKFEYNGTLTFLPGKQEEMKKGSSSKLDQEMSKLEQDLKKDEGFKTVEYIGHSKFKVAYKKEGVLTSPFYFVGRDIKLFSIATDKSGLVEVQGMKLNERDVKGLQAMNLSIDGKLTVKTDGEVIEHNATSTPTVFGLYGGYTWKVKSISDPAPKIIIKIK